MKISKKQRNNIIFLGLIVLLLIPQTRKPIQVFLNKGLALFGPSIENENNREVITDYNWNLKEINSVETTSFNSEKQNVIIINFGQLGALLV